MSALLVAALGFGVMNLFWYLGDWDTSVRGLWSFRTATLGDALLLPLIVGSLLFVTLSFPPADKERLPTCSAFVIGALSFLALVVSWLIDSGHELNWTMPQPHHLNAAGYYHVVFGTLVSGSLFAVAFLALRRSILARPHLELSPTIRSAWFVAFSGLLGFAGLAAIDPFESLEYVYEPWTLQTEVVGAIAIGAAAFFLVVAGMVIVFTKNGLIALWREALLILITGPVIAVAFWRPEELFDLPLGLVLPIFSMWVALLVHFLANRSCHWQFEVVVATLLTTLFLGRGLVLIQEDMSGAIVWLASGWVLFSLLFAGRVYGSHSWKENVPFVFSLGYAFYVLALAARFPSGEEASTTILLTALVLPITTLRIPQVVASRYAAVIEDELLLGDRLHGHRNDPADNDRCASLEQSYWASWTSIMAFFVFFLSSFLYLLNERGILDSIQTQIANDEPFTVLDATWFLLGLIAVGSGILLLLFVTIRRKTVTPETGGDSVPDLTISFGIFPLLVAELVLMTWIVGPWIASSAFDLYGPEGGSAFTIFRIAAAVLAALFASLTTESIIHNVAFMEFAQLRRGLVLLPITAGLATASAIWWLLTEGIWHGGTVTSIAVVGQLTGVIALAYIVFSVLTTLVLFAALPDVAGRPKGKPRYMSLHAPASHVGNDHVLYAFLLIFIVAVIYIAVSLGNDVSHIVLAVASPVAIIFALYAFFFGVTRLNADEHIRQERARLPTMLYLRSGLNETKAQCENQRRGEVIERHFKRVFLVVSFLSFAHLGINRIFSVLLPRHPEPHVQFESARIGSALEPFAGQLVYRFTLIGFEEIPLDGRISLVKRDSPDQEIRIEAFWRDWTKHSGNLDVSLPPRTAVGKYTLLVTPKDASGKATYTLPVLFDHEPYMESLPQPESGR